MAHGKPTMKSVPSSRIPIDSFLWQWILRKTTSSCFGSLVFFLLFASNWRHKITKPSSSSLNIRFPSCKTPLKFEFLPFSSSVVTAKKGAFSVASVAKGTAYNPKAHMSWSEILNAGNFPAICGTKIPSSNNCRNYNCKLSKRPKFIFGTFAKTEIYSIYGTYIYIYIIFFE